MLLWSNFSSLPQYFQNVSNLGVRLHIHSVKGGCSINCFPESANLICRSTDISNCFIESLGVRDNESRLYFVVTYGCLHLGSIDKDTTLSSDLGLLVPSCIMSDRKLKQKVTVSRQDYFYSYSFLPHGFVSVFISFFSDWASYQF